MQAIPSEPCPAVPYPAALSMIRLFWTACICVNRCARSCSSTRSVFSSDASSVAVCGAPTPRAGIMSCMADRRCSHSRPCLLRLQAGVRLTSNSYGGSESSQIWLDALSKQQEAGIMFVASAGNGAWAGRVWMRCPGRHHHAPGRRRAEGSAPRGAVAGCMPSSYGVRDGSPARALLLPILQSMSVPTTTPFTLPPMAPSVTTSSAVRCARCACYPHALHGPACACAPVEPVLRCAAWWPPASTDAATPACSCHACLSACLAVASSGAGDFLSPFSNWGPTTVHLTAPGSLVRARMYRCHARTTCCPRPGRCSP